MQRVHLLMIKAIFVKTVKDFVDNFPTSQRRVHSSNFVEEMLVLPKITEFAFNTQYRQ